YIVISETAKNIIIICKILHKLSIISENFAFSLLIDNISMIVISEDEKVTRNARHIDICYHHIQNLIEKKIIEISHISTDEMTVNNLTKMLLLNKFKKFVALIEISRIETSNSKVSNSKTSNSKSNDSKTDSDDKNDGKFMMNYYKEAGKAGKEADKEVSFETEEAK